MGQSKLILTCKRERRELIRLDLVEASSQGLEERVFFVHAPKLQDVGEAMSQQG